jgi:hypothetical protein
VNRPTAPPIDVFHGPLSPHSVSIYIRLESLPGGGDWSLSGQLHGPLCRHARTLPASAPLQDLGPGPSLVARALLTDPCFWSCDLPATYQLTVELRERGQRVETCVRMFALRDLAVRRRSFYWEGRRWVLRGVRYEACPGQAWSEWRERSAAAVVQCPDDVLCREASLEGVLLVARIDSAYGELLAQLRRLAQWPAVGVVVVDAAVEEAGAWRRAAPHVLLACGDVERADRIPPWAQVALAPAERLVDPRFYSSGPVVPLVATRSATAAGSLAEARAACDALQRDLAPSGDFAGYVVD